MIFVSDDGKRFNTEAECKIYEDKLKAENNVKNIKDFKKTSEEKNIPQWIRSEKYKLLKEKIHAVSHIVDELYSEIYEYANEIGLDKDVFYDIIWKDVEKDLEDEDDEPCDNYECDDLECLKHPFNNASTEEQEYFDENFQIVDKGDLIDYLVSCLVDYFVDCED